MLKISADLLFGKNTSHLSPILKSGSLYLFVVFTQGCAFYHPFETLPKLAIM